MSTPAAQAGGAGCSADCAICAEHRTASQKKRASKAADMTGVGTAARAPVPANVPKGPMGVFHAQQQRLQAQVASLEQQLQTALEEKAAALEEKAAMVAAKKALDAKPKPFPTMRAELEALKSSQSELESAKEELQVEHGRLEAAYKNLQTKHKTSQANESIYRTAADKVIAEKNALYTEFQSLKQQHEELGKTNSELQEKLDELKTTYEWDTKYLKMKARELSFFRTKWEDFANAGEAWLGNVPVKHLRWLEQDARKRVARIEALVEAHKLKAAGEEIANTPAAEDFKCVITQEVMSDPVTISDGHSYERAAIAQWFQERKLVSPLTNLPVDGTVTSNHALRKVIARALEAQVEAWKQLDPPHDPIRPTPRGNLF